MEKGDEFKMNCGNCGHMEKKHVNDIMAEPDNKIMLVGIGIGIILTIFL